MTLHRGERQPLSRGDAPYYVELAEQMRYSWVDSFIKWESNLCEMNRAKKELSEVKRADPAFFEFAERVRGSYASYRKRQVEAIAQYLFRVLAAPDPLERFHRAMAPDCLDVIEADAIEEALSFLEANYQGGITAAEKQKQVAGIEKKILKLQKEMAELLPPEQFETRHYQHGGIINMAEAFVDSWRQIATWTIGAVSPLGRVLRRSSEEEQKAFYALGLDRLTSRAARLAPYPD